MPRDPKNLRKSYEIKIGKDRADKLSDDQIGLLSKFYNQLSDSEQSELDSRLLKGYNDTLLHQMADEFISEKEDTSTTVETEIPEEEEEEDEDILPDLDELLGEIKADESAQSSSALAIYEGIRSEDLVDKEVDERILNLLGLEDVFDIDYGTYLTLLKEKMVAARMIDSQLSTEESELLTDEFKSVKGKVGRFRIKKKTISVDGFPFKASQGTGTASAITPEKFLPSTDNEMSAVDDALNNKLDELLQLIKEDYKLEEKEAKDKKITAENLRRRKKESKLEDGNKANKFLAKAAKKAFAPFQSIFDKILKFLGFTALGFVFDKFYKWWTDPENQKKVELLGRFLKDWWPSLSAAALLFLTPLGGFVRGTIKLLRGLLPRLLTLIRANPLAATAVAGAGLFAAGAVVPMVAPQTVEDEADTQANKAAKEKGNEQAAADIRTQNENRNPLQQFGDFITGAGAEREEQAERLETGEEKRYGFFGEVTSESPKQVEEVEGRAQGGMIHKATPPTQGGIRKMIAPTQTVNIQKLSIPSAYQGGTVTSNSGQDITGAGVDTQLVAAQPGEMIMPVATVNKYGSDFFMNLIKSSGKTGEPKMNNSVTFASNGGMVKVNSVTTMANGGMVGGSSNSSITNTSNTSNINSNLLNKIINSSINNTNTSNNNSNINTANTNSNLLNKIINSSINNTNTSNNNSNINTANNTNSNLMNKIINSFVNNTSGSQSLANSIVNNPLTQLITNRTSTSESNNTNSNLMNKIINTVTGGSTVINNVNSEFPRMTGAGGVNKVTEGLVNFENDLEKIINYSQIAGNTTNNYDQSTNISTQPLNMSPRSLTAPVGTPVVSSETRMIVLPPTTTVAKKPDYPVKSGSDIPEFNIIAGSGGRGRVIAALGIADLVGA